jgi:hypothetical protein
MFTFNSRSGLMDITIVNKEYASGATELYYVLWKRHVARYYPFAIYLGMMLGLAVLFAVLHDDIRGFSGGLIFVLVIFLLIYITQFVREKNAYTVRGKEMADRHLYNGNECTFRFTEHTFFYSTFEVHQEIKWHTFKQATVDQNWLILESDYAMFGIRQQLVTEEQRSQILSFLKEKKIAVKMLS